MRKNGEWGFFMTEKEGKLYIDKRLKTMLIVFGCIFVNFLGRHIADVYSIPLWLDCFGTVFAAYVLGPVSGAIGGATGNLIYSFWNPPSLAYGLTSIFIGVSVGLAARRKYFDSFFGATSLAGGVTIGSVLISTVLNIAFYDGQTGNVWGDGVKEYLEVSNVSSFIACATGELYIDFLDKLATVLSLFYLIKIVRYIKKARSEKKPGKKRFLINMLLIPILAGLIFFPKEVRADDSNEGAYIQRVYDGENGLPCGHANDIAQTNDGILWVGSYAGLYRYNGSTFTFMEDFDAVKNVNCLYADEEGRLWIGTNDSGVVIAIEDKQANILNTNKGLPSDSVRCIVQSSDGEYYVGTSDKMAVVKLKDGINLSKDIPEIRYAQSISADREGRVATVTAEGKLYVLKNEEIIYDIPELSGESKYSACAFDENGVLYAGTTEGRLAVFTVTDKEAELVKNIECRNVSRINQINFKGERIWILSDTGIGYVLDDRYVKEETGDFNSSIVKMTVDYQGNLWFASTRHGLLQLSESRFSNLFGKYGIEQAVVNSTALKDGLLYVGADNGLYILNLSVGISVKNELTEILEGCRIRCIKSDSKGNLWICSYGKGLIRYSSDGEIKVFDEETYGIGSWTRVVTELSNGNIVVGSDTGVNIIGPGEKTTTIPYGDELGSSQILSMCELPDKRLFVGTDGNGIGIVDDGKVEGRITKEDGLSSGVILRLVYDSKSEHLFVVTSNGLCRIKDDAVSVISEFPYSNNYDLILDDDGEAFILGSAGIYVVKKSALLSDDPIEYTLLNSRVGLRGAITANSWNEVTEKENMYLCTDRGVILMNLDHYRPGRKTYRLMVSQIKLDDVPTPIERGIGLTIGKNVNSIEFVPEIVNYTLEDPRVSYYLEGLESDYKTVYQSELGGVIYTNLPSGEYVFHLAILDENGKKIEESTYGFTKEKPIYANRWFLAYMLIVGGLFIGWLSWFITRFVTQRTIALQQERLELALKQVQMGNETILAIAKTVDAKDSMTSEHSLRVSDYSVLIAEEYGFNKEEQENLRKAALLHDIGKIGIPDKILNKPAKLSDSEYEIMKTHVTRGAEILKDFTLIDHVVEGARYHHERYDGSGYPDGLKGDNIPLYGRIIAIADAFDAMTANRVYRKKLGFADVIKELKGGRGTQFDPELMDLFLRIIDEGKIDIEKLYGNTEKETADE